MKTRSPDGQRRDYATVRMYRATKERLLMLMTDEETRKATYDEMINRLLDEIETAIPVFECIRFESGNSDD